MKFIKILLSTLFIVGTIGFVMLTFWDVSPSTKLIEKPITSQENNL